MIFQLGDIRFEILDGPTALRIEDAKNFVQKERIKGKPVLEEVGQPLTSVDLRITLSYQYVGVPIAIATLKAAMASSEEKELIDATGRTYGKFKIESMSREILKVDGQGTVTRADIDLRLIEYAPYNQEQEEKVKARQRAFATIEAKPIEVKVRDIYSTPPAKTSINITQSTATAKAGMSNLRKAASIPDLFNKYMKTAQRQLNNAANAMRTARSEANNLTSTVSNAAQLKASIDSTIRSFDTLLPQLTSVNPLDLPAIITSSGSVLETQLRSLNSAASVLTAVTATRL